MEVAARRARRAVHRGRHRIVPRSVPDLRDPGGPHRLVPADQGLLRHLPSPSPCTTSSRCGAWRSPSASARCCSALWALGYPGRSAWLLVLWVGFGAMFRGIGDLVAAFTHGGAPGMTIPDADSPCSRPSASPSSLAPACAEVPSREGRQGRRRGALRRPRRRAPTSSTPALGDLQSSSPSWPTTTLCSPPRTAPTSTRTSATSPSTSRPATRSSPSRTSPSSGGASTTSRMTSATPARPRSTAS